jgi:hypothetical protein
MGIQNTSNTTSNSTNDTSNVRKSFPKELYTVSDTLLTHRQVNALSEDNLVPDNRESAQEWRKFNFVEVIYMRILYHLKKFGIEHETLHEFKQSYFQVFAEMMLDRVFKGEEIILTVTSKGHCTFYTSTSYLLQMPKEPFVHIQVNSIVNAILKKTENGTVPMKYSLLQRALLGKDFKSVKEKELIDIVRNKNYKEVLVRKPDGRSFIVHAEGTSSSGEGKSLEEILDAIKNKEFCEITAVKRNGKVVCYKIKDTYKL